MENTHRSLPGRIAAALLLLAPLAAANERPYPRFEPTPPEIVTGMLKLANVTARDVVYDLGSGDGRIVIAAVQDFGAARAVGVELDAKLVARAESAALEAGVNNKVSFVRKDLFDADIAPATVVTLYLLPEVNLMLRPKLLRDLRPGTRVVSHSHDMGDWKPDRMIEVTDRRGDTHRLYLWTIPRAQAQEKYRVVPSLSAFKSGEGVRDITP